MFTFFLFLSNQYFVQVCAFLKDKVNSRLSGLSNKLKIQIKDLAPRGTANWYLKSSSTESVFPSISLRIVPDFLIAGIFWSRSLVELTYPPKRKAQDSHSQFCHLRQCYLKKMHTLKLVILLL